MSRAGEVVSRGGDERFLVIRDELEGLLVVATCHADGSLRTVQPLGEPGVSLMDPETANAVGRAMPSQEALRLWRRMPEGSKEKVRAKAREVRFGISWADVVDRIKAARPDATIHGEPATGRLLVGAGDLAIVVAPGGEAWDVSWADSGTKEAGFRKGISRADACDSVVELLCGGPLDPKEWGAPR